MFFGDVNGGISLFRDLGADKLSGSDKALYDNLKALIKEIAAGDRAATQNIPVSCDKSWTLEELGLTATAGNEAIMSAVKGKLSQDMDVITSYLLMDCPYDFYWYLKSAGGGMSWAYSLSQNAGKWSVTNLQVSFVVAEGYRAEDAYHVNTAKVNAAKEAAGKAAQIVTENAGKSDYEKLKAYCQKICELTSYNDSAATTATPYGDPWQLIYVFDGKSSTSVVCEGYSKAFQYLCDLSGFDGCYTVTGIMSGGTGSGGHMWNIVTLEGRNYLVDVTNCDAGTVGAPDKLFLAGTAGSVDAGYTFQLNTSITYQYDSDQPGLFGNAILTLASENYAPREALQITPPTVSAITYGDEVNSSVFQGGAAQDTKGNPVTGTFDWADNVKESGYGDAGKKTLQVVFIPDDTAKYSRQTVSIEVTVEKSSAADADASQTTKYGNADTYDLTRLLEDGAQSGAAFGTIQIEGDSSIFEGTPTIEGTKLSYKLVNDDKKAGQSATIIVPVETTNYNPFHIRIKVVVSAKQQQDNLRFDLSSSEIKKTYGDEDFVVAVRGAAKGSNVSYESNNPAVASVDAASGKVHILKRGTVTITATASETDDYVSRSITCTLTVSPKALTWDVSGLHAVDKQGTVGSDTKRASLYGELRVSGILSADVEKVSFVCPAEGENSRLYGTYADIKPGAQKVTLQWSGEPVVLTGTGVENYTLPDTLPEITGRINAVTEQTNVPESTDAVQYKLEIEDGISQVPEALKNNPELNTPVKIEEKMKYEIRARLTEGSSKNNVEVYDVVLMVKDGENGWVAATEENFPKDGITVTLPYPEGTGKDTHNFKAAHMFTHTWNGRTAGEIEYPEVSKINEGIRFKVTSLSPIGIGWEEVKADNAGNTNAGNANRTTQNQSPKTGDENAVMLYVLLMMLGAAGVGFTMKRKAIRE